MDLFGDMKIKLKTIEKITKYKIKQNVLSIGLDLAMRTGICSIHTDNHYAYFKWLFLEFDSINEKILYRNMVNAFENLMNKQNIAIIEKPFVGFSRSGSMKLSTFCGFAICEAIKKSIPYELISAVSARSKFKIDTRSYGKGKSKVAVADWLKKNFKLELDDNDISDSIILALCGICKGIKFK